MKFFRAFFFCAILLIAIHPSTAAVESGNDAEASPTPKVKYKAGKAINFEELLIQGQMKRPELSIVTANEKKVPTAFFAYEKISWIVWELIREKRFRDFSGFKSFSLVFIKHISQ